MDNSKRKSNKKTPQNKRINKENMKKANRKTQHIRIDEEDYQWIKDTAYIERISMKDLVSKVIKEYKAKK